MNSILGVLLNGASGAVPVFVSSGRVRALPNSVPAKVTLSTRGGIVGNANNKGFDPFNAKDHTRTTTVSLHISALVASCVATRGRGRSTTVRRTRGRCRSGHVACSSDRVPASGIGIGFAVGSNGAFAIRLCPGRTPRAITGFMDLIGGNFCGNLGFREMVSNFITRNNSPGNSNSNSDNGFVCNRFTRGNFRNGALGRAAKAVSVTEANMDGGDTSSNFFVYCTSRPDLSKTCTTFNRMVRKVRAIGSFLRVRERVDVVNRLSIPGRSVVVGDTIVMGWGRGIVAWIRGGSICFRPRVEGDAGWG